MGLPEDNDAEFTVVMANFEKHQTRKDIQSMQYIRLATNIYMDEKFMMLTSLQRDIFFYLLTAAGRQMHRKDGELTGQLRTSVRAIAKQTQSKYTATRLAVSRLEEFHILKSYSRNVPVPRVEKSRVENTWDIEAIYNAYPRKDGKANGLKKLQKIIKSTEQFNEILNGAQKLKEFHEAKGTEQRFIPLFSTWVNAERWKDELSDANGATHTPRKKAWNEQPIW